MKRKLFVIFMAAVMAFSTSAFAGEAAGEVPAAEETTAAEGPKAEAAEELPVQADIGGLYVANYAEAEKMIDLTTINRVDLICTAQEAGTTIYDFGEDGTVTLYAGGEAVTGTYTAADGRLTITADDTYEYDYEIIDGLLVLHSGKGSSILYDFAVEDMNYISIEDYSTIEIDKEKITVTDADIDTYINTVLQGQTTYEEITEGVTADGDVITISFEGYLEGEEEPFEGGSEENVSLRLGSGALIDTYEEQLTGCEIGSEVDVNITFPEDYEANPDLIGKNATFKTTILSKTVAHTPELTDEWVKSFSADYLTQELDSVEAFREYSRSYLEEYVLHAAILNALAAKTTITGYNSTVTNLMIGYSAKNLAYYASAYGYTQDQYAKMYGYESAAEYEKAEAVSFMNISMITNKVMEDLGLTYTLEELDGALNDYLKLSGYKDVYTAEEYKAEAGEAGTWTYRNLEFKYNMAMKALEDRVVIVEKDTPSEEELTAEAATAEAVAKE